MDGMKGSRCNTVPGNHLRFESSWSLHQVLPVAVLRKNKDAFRNENSCFHEKDRASQVVVVSSSLKRL